MTWIIWLAFSKSCWLPLCSSFCNLADSSTLKSASLVFQNSNKNNKYSKTGFIYFKSDLDISGDEEDFHIFFLDVLKLPMIFFKGTVSVISSDLPCKTDIAGCPIRHPQNLCLIGTLKTFVWLVPLKPLSDWYP